MTNLIDNGHFETDTDGWGTDAGATIARSTDNPYVGDACVRISAAASAYSGMNWGFGGRTFTSGVTYRFRFGAQRISGASDTWYFEWYDRDASSTLASTTFTAPEGWTEFYLDWTPGADYTNVSAGIYHVAASVAVLAADEVSADVASADDPLGYDEAALSPFDGEGESLVVTREPTANPVGVSTPGMLAALTDFINFGVSNGNFRQGPPDPSANITPASSSATASNFLPDWRFVQSSNTNITLTQVRDASSPSGSNVRFTFASGSASDEAYIEQMVDIGGSRFQQIADYVRGSGIKVSGSGVQAKIDTQYLTSDGSIVGMPPEDNTGAFGDLSTVNWQFNSASATNPPGSARYLRLRVVASRASGTGAASLDVCEIRRDPGKTFLALADFGAPNGFLPSYLHQSDGLPSVFHRDMSTTNLLGWKLVPLPFMYNNIPANTTREMLPWDNNMTLGGVPRIILPWTAYIVGMSYRISAAPSAGTINFQATIGGSNVWSPFGALGSGMLTGDAAEQPLATDVLSAGSGVGVQMVTNAAYTPTTRHAVVVLWLAVAYSGG